MPIDEEAEMFIEIRIQRFRECRFEEDGRLEGGGTLPPEQTLASITIPPCTLAAKGMDR